MMILIYNLVLLILLPIMVTRIVIKGFKDRDYLLNFINRFGIYKDSSKDNLIWFHAVSLGEVIGSEKILRKFIGLKEIILTVSTPTGLRYAKKLYDSKITIVYAPWDLYIFVWLFIKKFNPICLVLFETEIWPSMIFLCSKKNIPIILSNARLSESSFRKYLSFSKFSKYILSKVSLVLAQSESHVKRFIQIGFPKERLIQVGSVKFDTSPINHINSQNIFAENKIFLATSTHEQEDEIVIESYVKLLKDFPSMKLIIVPRHPERCSSILNIFVKKKIKASIESNLDFNFENSDGIILNSIGKLNSLYDLADVAFIGGSLFSKYGGHNIIEPAQNRCAIIVGPFMMNFEDVLNLFKDADACVQIKSYFELPKAYKELMNNNELRINMIDNAVEVIEKNRGSSETQYKCISDLINHEISDSNS